jgi:hypothetical protein
LRCFPWQDCGREFRQPSSGNFRRSGGKHPRNLSSTDLGASNDQAEMLGFGMLTADLQTMSYRRRQARL